MEEAGWRSAPKDANPKHDINEMRQTIDALDHTIANLLKQRLLLTCDIGAVKAGSRLPVKDNGREEQVLSNIRSVTQDSRIASALAEIYRTVIDESCKLQNSPEPDAGEDAVLYFPRVLIIGTGLIGGAIARQIKNRLPGTIVCALDTPATLEQARSNGLIDRAETNLREAVAGAGLILLCASPEANLHLLTEIAPLTKRRQVVMDVTSTKEQICRLAEKLSMKADFVGGHPLFGSHQSGLESSAQVGVDGQRFCVVKTARSSELTLRRLLRWLSELGLRTVTADAQEHDAALAATSHAVQLTAIALGRALADGRSDADLQKLLRLSGPSLKNWSRLMASPARMWLDIISQNRQNVKAALDKVIEHLQETRRNVENADDEAIEDQFRSAARVPAMLEALAADQ